MKSIQTLILTCLLFISVTAAQAFPSVTQKAAMDSETLKITALLRANGTGNSEDSPLEITTAAQLAEIAALTNAGKLETFITGKEYDEENPVYFKLMNDIDLSAYGKNWNNGAGWICIGNGVDMGGYNYVSFRGIFDGNGHKITGLYINDSNQNFAGLFGYISGGTVKNLGVEKMNIKGKDNLGGIAGYVDMDGTIDNCYTSGKISGAQWVGGVVGLFTTYYQSPGNVMSNCHSSADAGGRANIGGVVGRIGMSSLLTNCYATGNIYHIDGLQGSSNNGYYFGGVVGYTGNDSKGTENCYFTGSVSGLTFVGGVTGIVGGNARVSNCYSTGTVNGNSSVGGITGSVFEEDVVDNCVALNPSVKGNARVGRVMGWDNATASHDNNFAFSGMTDNGGLPFILSELTHKHNGIDGGDVNKAQVIDADFWENTMDWDITNVWLCEKDKLPVLRSLAGQNGDPGLYLTQRNVAYAYLATETYIYTGDIIYPTVKWGDDELVKDTDYTIVITSSDGEGTSAGTNTGIVSFTITGIGDYKGTNESLTYTITAQSGIEKIRDVKELTVLIKEGILYISGLTIGKPWSIYNVSGALIYEGVATNQPVETGRAPSLPMIDRGIYIVKSGDAAVKFVY